ncbi:DUF2815 family protein [Xinfangfangia sp. CPCC 101601]|uniref:DUF2815 family protein n=1 Tax=Pseudogemmobacter lacusdianii TaxID=3069608 RepID=A0ABU0VYK7_9RHOB|nr:ssDNA-binding protein [Xinfangfangia sp. CPCC 101601]MDQ2066713.1 DUF2815 family protein [Xinfangfangia sp. CPCC 101601]
MARFEFKTHVSPKVEAMWCFLSAPQAPFKEGAAAMYAITGILDDTEDNRAWIDGIISTAQAEAKKAGVKLKKVFHNPFEFPEDVDEDEYLVDPATGKSKRPEQFRGKIIFKAKTQFQPGQIDSARVDLPPDVKIFGGDIVKIKFAAEPYENGANSGITLRLRTVQLLEKRTSFNRGPDTDGFEDEDGYRAGGGGGEGHEDF